MSFKKKYKKKFKRDSNLLSLMSNKFYKVKPYKDNMSYEIKKSINYFVEDSFDNNLIFFAIEIKSYLCEISSSKSEDEIKLLNTNKENPGYYIRKHEYNIEDLLEEVDFLEFAYLTRKNNKSYLLFAVKGLLGYSSHFISNLYSSLSFLLKPYTNIINIKKKKDVIQYFNFLVKDSDFKDAYCFKGNFLNKQPGGRLFTSIFSTEKEDKFFIDLYGFDRISKSLKLKSFSNLSNMRTFNYLFYYNKVYNKESLLYDANRPQETFHHMVYKKTILFFRNDKKIISCKKESEQGIINLWLLYMKANNLYVKDFKIYDKKESGEICYVSELDFLKYNIGEIINYLKQYFSFQLSEYPIENLVLKYLGSAYEKILLNPYYYLPYLEEELIDELLDKYLKLNEKFYDLERDELSMKIDVAMDEYIERSTQEYEKLKIENGWEW